MDRIVGGKFKLGKKIGCGSFGVIYLGEPIVRFPAPPELPFPPPRLVSLFAVLFLTLSPIAGTDMDTYEIVAVKIVSSYIRISSTSIDWFDA
jgi:serine/threonine protein kinase